MSEYLSIALTSFLSVEVIIALIVGVVGGMVIGIIPGLGPSVGIALLLPISFSMSPTAALVMMTAMYTTGVYGGSITAVLCHTPGTAASAATTMDGYEMTRQGRGMEAISVVTVASVAGGIIGAVCLILFAPALGRISLMFSTLEYFLVACFGVLVVAGLTGENQAKGIFAALFGLLIGCVGMDSISGVSRFTFGQLWLEDGLDSTPILIGLFSISQVLMLVEKLMRGKGSTIAEDPGAGLKGRRWSRGNTKKLTPTMVRSSVIGSFIGFIPAAGASIAASESANNAACGGAMIPLFTLGIPGSPVTAILYGALLMHGLQPGSDLFIGAKAPMTYAIFLGYLFANILMGVIGVSMAKQMARIVLADILESNFRRTLIIAETKGGLAPYFFSRPIAIVIVFVILGFSLVPVFRKMQARKAAAS